MVILPGKQYPNVFHHGGHLYGKTIPMFQVVKSMAISGTDLLEVPTIYIYICICKYIYIYKGRRFKAFF